MGEKREAYVRSRFADVGEYWKHDIEDWLKDQRVASVPDDSWGSFLSSSTILNAARHREIAILRKHAEAVRVTPKTPGIGVRLKALLASLDPYKASVYLGQAFGPVILFAHGTEPPSFLVEREDDGWFSFQKLKSAQVIDVLFTAWKNQAPKYEEARAFLCNALSDEIARVRQLAENEFDDAVAVSDDGKLIVQADWVVLFDRSRGDTGFTQHPAEKFRKDKLGYDPDGVYRDDTNFDEGVDDFFNKSVQGRTSAGILHTLCLTSRIPQMRVNLTKDDMSVFFSDVIFVRGASP